MRLRPCAHQHSRRFQTTQEFLGSENGGEGSLGDSGCDLPPSPTECDKITFPQNRTWMWNFFFILPQCERVDFVVGGREFDTQDRNVSPGSEGHMFHMIRSVAPRIWVTFKHTAHKSPDHKSEDVKDKRSSVRCQKILFKIILNQSLEPLHFHFYAWVKKKKKKSVE